MAILPDLMKSLARPGARMFIAVLIIILGRPGTGMLRTSVMNVQGSPALFVQGTSHCRVLVDWKLARQYCSGAAGSSARGGASSTRMIAKPVSVLKMF